MQNPHLTLTNIPRGAEAYALAQLSQGGFESIPARKTLVLVCSGDRAMNAVADALPFFAPHADLATFPAWDCLPYDRVSPRAGLMAERLQTLSHLLQPSEKPLILLTTANAVLTRLIPAEMLRKNAFALKAGARVNRDALLEFLAGNGYRRLGKAIEPGEYAVRGSIVDIVPPGHEQGVRLDWFGDELESLRLFDPLSQVSSDKADALTLLPAGEVLLNDDTITRFRNNYRERFGAVSKDDPLYESVSQGIAYPGMEHWLPLFYEHTSTLADYLPEDTLWCFESEAEPAITERQDTIADYYSARIAAKQIKAKDSVPYYPLPPEASYLMADAWEQFLEKREALFLSPFEGEEGRPRINASLRPAANLAGLRQQTPGQNPFEQLREHALAKRSEGKATLLAALTKGAAERLSALLGDKGAHIVRIDNAGEIKRLSAKSIGLATLPLEHGFEAEDFAIVTEMDLLGERIIRARPKKQASERFLEEAANFGEGELVVHREHGIGRFEGLVTVEAGGARHDCLKLIYEDDDKLFLPVENIEMVTRYGSEEDGVKLDKLGAASWQNRKARMKERIKLAAEVLLKTAAARLLRKGRVLQPTEAYENFTANFGYVETDDQQRSIDEVIEDLGSGRPMDRLICGDVGFGKTEVALRAAFVAVSGKKVQVALIVPTTLLARQHYANFAKRFEGFPVTVRQLSRMVPAKEQKATREGLKDGSVDIVIGTHAVLSKQVEFKNLGLVIIDEEQHFGVGQKEKLKELCEDVHVLTLSATPIPRTLQMALTGVRDLSLITTPPVDRLATRSFVMPYDPVVLREAILREQHRGGRIFAVCPRIKDMAELRVRLHALVPEIKIGVAHGQMSAGDLDEVMNDFHDGKYDLLLSTAIIESGLDIPTANTMMIFRADMFGLSQLYQLRGRVGRGKLRAYCYFLLPGKKEITKTATRRLEVMQSLDTLGAGFSLASHDMDIRGFGNLVGEEQSGHIREVGVELYQQMLKEAVEKLRKAASSSGLTRGSQGVPGEEKDPRVKSEDDGTDDWSPAINLGLTILIPEQYVEDLELRLSLYRRAATLATPDDIDSFTAELIDRFGPLPEEVQQLLATVRIKQLCKQACIDRIDAGPKGAVLSFRNDCFTHPEALLAYITKHPTRLKLRPDQKLIFMKEWKDEEEKIRGVTKLAEEIAGL